MELRQRLGHKTEKEQIVPERLRKRIAYEQEVFFQQK